MNTLKVSYHTVNYIAEKGAVKSDIVRTETDRLLTQGIHKQFKVIYNRKTPHIHGRLE